MQEDYVLGIDYGTDSVRAVVFSTATGVAVGEGVSSYRRWKNGDYCDAAVNGFRQHPLDYLESLEQAVGDALNAAPAGTALRIGGLSIDTTGSTPVAVNRQGLPLALSPGFENNPNAMFILWKDHTATREADDINRVAREWGGEDFTRFSGGTYSPEWFWAKVLHILRNDAQVRERAFSWVEHCDWISAELTGDCDPLTLKRSRCAAGHKAMWHRDFDGLPSEEFLSQLDPLLDGLRQRLYYQTHTSDKQAGVLSASWAEKLGLSPGISVGVGALDAHMGAVGAGIRPHTLVKVIGTSSCDMLTAPIDEMDDRLINGICGQVDGSIIPGMLGLEAGQSAFGDIFAWFRELLLWPLKYSLNVNDSKRSELLREARDSLLSELSSQASKIAPGESAIVALDWMNGRRTPNANPAVKGAIAGLTLGSEASMIFRSLVEATAFGAKCIVDCFVSQGVQIDQVIALGGVARKSPLVMQILADVLEREISVSAVDQACALGSAMYASVASGIHHSIEDAQAAMNGGIDREYHPDPARSSLYRDLYQEYIRLGKMIDTASAGPPQRDPTDCALAKNSA